jgi:hypothetical protein
VVAEIKKKISENKSKLMFAVIKLTSIKIEVINIRAKNVAGFFIWFVFFKVIKWGYISTP